MIPDYLQLQNLLNLTFSIMETKLNKHLNFHDNLNILKKS